MALTAPLPTGAVTFAFTDIEGSTVRWERDRVAMQEAVRRHDAILRRAIAEHGGQVFKTIGDAFCITFERPENAVAAMLAAQRMLAAEDFSAVDGLRVRAAINSGTADAREGDYFGPAVNKVAGIASTRPSDPGEGPRRRSSIDESHASSTRRYSFQERVSSRCRKHVTT